MNFLPGILLHTLLLILPTFCFSQAGYIAFPDSSQSYVELYGYGSSNSRTPFWMQANQFGTISKISPTGSARIGIENYWNLSVVRDPDGPWRAGFGVEVVANGNQKSKVLIPQLHGSLRYKNWELFIGRKKQWIGLADSTIGTGSYPWSGNALPIPKIQIGTTKFVDVPFTKGWISFNGFYSDGVFEKNRPVTSGLKFHHKALYLRIGRAGSIVKLYGGANHQVQWGGKSPYLSAQNDDLPDGFKNYLNVIRGKIGGEGESVTHFDSTSRVGNHLGSIDIAVEIETYETNLYFYRQTIYEDGSLFYLQALKDGLNGFRIKRKNSYGDIFEIEEGVLEFLYTKDQGGDDFVLTDGKKRGRDNYFNNQQVRDGWSYFDRTIGTPFIPPTSDTKWNWPVYADNFTSNNRVMVFHLGLKGNVYNKIKWHSKLSYSRNSGTYLGPFTGSPTQFSGLIALQTKINFLGGSIIKGSIASDIGKLYPNTFGFSLGIRKDFNLD
ncbi:hypothetical protein DYBT9275_03842 [Dyadobacter sp. CECT 9275]|uniref:Capsule assembly protein Wzi n=1 Tax=Dyadobacter helix TaxID=2822344 RepID=A0A916JE85_9BACT|nr:capsule assembly Wzi family protein [Dyadobacter sp. CECT 9275]CAG5006542.1 hypothetical protein DYBT9275_03842 [Dyadobacter sp. CECT 9275]